MTLTRVVALALLVCAASPAFADELELVGRHALSGQVATRTFTGSIEIRDDATYAGERRFADGAVEVLAGRVAFDERALVLAPATGMRGALVGASARALRYARADEGKVVRWRHAEGDVVEVIALAGEEGGKLELIGRILRQPIFRYLFKDNRGLLDRTAGLEIHRSSQPSPNDVVRMQTRHQVKTVLSLNGDLDEDATYWEDVANDPSAPPVRRRVNLGRFVAERGLNHEIFSMSASRVPSDAELVGIFRVLLDDSKKPILMHCRGGSDRTGIISALYEIEFLGVSKADAKTKLRRHLWIAEKGTEIQGAYLDLYQPGSLRRLLAKNGVRIPARFPAP
jgi:hypothetical protein